MSQPVKLSPYAMVCLILGAWLHFASQAEGENGVWVGGCGGGSGLGDERGMI